MTTQQDAQIGLKKESVYATKVTVDSFVEFTDEDLAHSPTYSQGNALRVGRRVAAADRRTLVKEEVGGSFTIEAGTKGLGKLFEAALGSGVSNVASGAAYQQLFTPTATDYLPSYTIQKGLPPLGGGTTTPLTFAGMICSGFEFSAGNGEVPTIKFNWMGKDVDTGTSLATASYLSGVSQFSFINATLTIGGSVTVPTTTALGTGGTATANIRDFNLTYDNGLDTNGFNFGSAGKRSRKQAVGLRGITGSVTAEFDSTTLQAAYLAQTDLALVFTLTDVTAITGAYYPTLQFTIPNIRLEGELPKAAAGDVITQAIDFTGLDGRVASHPIYVAIVTAETAI